MRTRSRLLPAFLAAALLASAVTPTRACPICGQPTVTLAERLATVEAALLAQWVSASTGDEDRKPETIYEIVEVRRQGNREFRKGERLTLPGAHAGQPGSLVLLLGAPTAAGEIKWDDPPLAVTETSYQYIVQAPSPEAPRAARLDYFRRFLEYPDLVVANDAFAEFVNAPAKDIFALADKLPRDKLRQWVADENTPVSRQAGYGLMLGLCGEPRDAELLLERICDTGEDRRSGIEGVMVGYLLLAGPEGLTVLEREILSRPDAPDGDLYASAQALRYFWTYGADRIPRIEIERAVQQMLDRPQMAASVIPDLARWKDWSVLPRIAELYGAPGYEDRQTRMAVLRYLIAATKDVPKEPGTKRPAHVESAEKALERLRRQDVKLAEEAEKFFFLQ